MTHVGEELGFVLACFGELPALVLDLVEQADIFNCDGGLVGEGRNQFDLLVGERTDLVAEQGQHADGRAVAHHRHDQ